MRVTKRVRNVTLLILGMIAVVIFGTAGACGPATPAEQDAATSAQNTGQLIAKQPVAAGQYSNTRNNINKWNQTWQSGPGKLAYTYIYQQGVPNPIGYYVLAGPPTSYAANATEPYSKRCDTNGCELFANPGQDGAYYNQGTGGNQFYGFDAQSGRILEFGGDGLSYFLSDQPLRLNAPPIGDAVIGQGKIPAPK